MGSKPFSPVFGERLCATLGTKYDCSPLPALSVLLKIIMENMTDHFKSGIILEAFVHEKVLLFLHQRREHLRPASVVLHYRRQYWSPHLLHDSHQLKLDLYIHDMWAAGEPASCRCYSHRNLIYCMIYCRCSYIIQPT